MRRSHWLGVAEGARTPNALLQQLWGMYWSSMIHVFSAAEHVMVQESSDTALQNAWNFLPGDLSNKTGVPGTNFGCVRNGGPYQYVCTGYPQLTATDFAASLALDRMTYTPANYPPVPPYLGTLVPCHSVNGAACPSTTDATFVYAPWASQENDYAFVGTAGQPISFTLDVSLGMIRDPRVARPAVPITFEDPAGHILLSETVLCVDASGAPAAGDYCSGSITRSVTASTTGTYTLHILDAGKLYFLLSVPHNQPVAMVGAYSNPYGGTYRGDAAHYEGMYFYVPKNTMKFIVHRANAALPFHLRRDPRSQ